MDMFKNNVIVIAITTFAIAVVMAFVFVLVKGGDTDKLSTFLSWLLTVVPVAILGLVMSKNNATISKQVESVGTGVSNVETATNGMLTARLNAQTDEIKAHTVEAINAAIGASPTLPPPDYTHTNTIVN